MRCRIGKEGYYFRNLEKGAGPTVGDHQRHRVGAGPFLMDKVDVDAFDVGHEVGEAVETFLLCPPVKFGAPVFHQLLDVGQIGAVVPIGTGNLVGPPGTGKAVFQVL